MSLEELQGRHNDFYTPRFEVKIGDETVEESSGVISSVTVDTTLNKASLFSFNLDYPFDHELGQFGEVEEGQFKAINWDTFAPGKKVDIRMGYGTQPEDETEPMVVGKISSVRPDFPSSGKPTIEVSGYDLLHDMTQVADYQFWSNEKDSKAVKDVTNKYDFTELAIKETDLIHQRIKLDPNVYHNHLQFIAKLAKRNRYEFFARGRTFHFRPSSPDTITPTLTLRYGGSLLSFSPSVNKSNRVNKVEVHHWNSSSGEVTSGVAEQENAENNAEKIKATRTRAVPVRSGNEADNVAEAMLYEETHDQGQGYGETIGLPELRVGEAIRLEGIDTYSDTYYLQRVTHRIGSSGYTASFSARRRST